MFAQNGQGFQGDFQIPRPAIQGMDNNDVKFVPGDIIKEFPENRTPSNGIDMG
jgi:hypothetical protein